MKLAFSNRGHYTEFESGFELYKTRAKKETVDFETYKRIVRRYCELLADKLCETGMIDLPENLGSIAAATFKRKPQYIGKQFVGYGKYDWTRKCYDGNIKAFGLVYLPKHGKNNNLRCFGFVANRRLFQKMRDIFTGDESKWPVIEFNDTMI